jgi:hypothetical protein
MTEELPTGTSLDHIQVETNAPSAPVEQQSTEPTVTPEPIETPVEAPVETPAEEPVAEPVKEKDNELALAAFKEKIRADEAERRLKEFETPLTPTNEPDINDKSTWGKKYQDAPNDFETFKAAYRDWAKAEGAKESVAELNQRAEQQKQLEIRANVAKRESESRAKHPDFDAVVAPVVPIISNIPVLKDFIAKNPMGTEVAYELAKNPAVLKQLSTADAWEAGETLINMAARLKKPAPVSVSNAPSPIKPVGSRETVKPRLSQMSDADYVSMRNKQELAAKFRT